MDRKNILAAIFLLCSLSIGLSCGNLLAQEGPADGSKVIGEAFGKKVTEREFNYYFKTALIFTRSGKNARSEDETRQEAWQNFIFRHAAREEGITVGRDALESEIKRLLNEKDIEYGSKDYRLWAMMQFGEEPEALEHRIEDLLVINKFMKIKTNPEVTVTDEEIEQKFRNQYNSFESEYIYFDTKEKAAEFLTKVKKDPALWKKTYDKKKPDGQKGASWINIMSLEALIDLWKIPKDDAYSILSHNKGDFILAKFYYGDAVFRLLRKKTADMSKFDDKKKEYYRNTITKYRKRKIAKEYFEGLLKRADVKDYVSEARRAEKIKSLKKKRIVALKTNSGIITLKLFPEIAPFACENFVGLIEKGYYDGLIFHRVIKDFMIQGGDPTGTGTGGDSIWGEPFVDEISEDVQFDRPGLLAMANSGANTNKSQFFITVKATPWLNKKHTIFGEVIKGLDVVKKINAVESDSKDKPKEEQKIIKATVLKEEKSDDKEKEKDKKEGA